MEIKFSKLEKRILRYWKENSIFGKSIERRKKAKDFVFYEGPPTANGKPGIHHFLSRSFKDLVCRYKTMKGFKVQRKAGWDTHGLPVEIEIEKKLGLKNKLEIEKFGIEKFNQLCKKSVWEYKKEWEKFSQRIAYWIDLKNPYITYTRDYIESVWYILKNIWEKKLLYQDFKVSPYCPRCGTTLSSHEVAQGYKLVKDPSIFVKFRILNPEFENTSLLIWTTTPWTLPGNVAVALNPDFEYVKVKVGQEYLILAKKRFEDLKIEGEILKTFKGKDLIGLKYNPPYPVKEKYENIYKVLPADFVSLEEGTGLVHIAPAFGEEDMELIKKENLKLKNQKAEEFPVLITVDEQGKFKLFVEKFAGLFVKEADPLIIEDLKEKNLLFRAELYEHEYPFCWRCKTPLIYYAKKSWFIKMSSLKEKLIKNNQKINWIPAHIKNGRFGEWLREVKDWALSRERYWGTPLPIWKCKVCQKEILLTNRDDFLAQKFSQNRYLLLRHGESLMNVNGIIVSQVPEKIPSPLTEKGRKEIEKLAKKLKNEKIDLIFSSDLQRTKETAQIIGEILNIKPIFSKKLREINAGIFEGKSLKEYQSFWENYSQRFQKRPKGGENYQDVKKRVFKFIKELENKYQGKTILIISHARPLLMLEAAVLGLDIKETEKLEKRKLKTGQFREIEFKDFPYDENGEINFHRPYVDRIKFYCPNCHNLMERVPEVIDCWFDSGAMPFAQCHWPFENQKLKTKNQKLEPPKLFPADFISEGIDQTRGWFYTLLAISTLLDFGPAYKTAISLAHVLDEKGEKMSKSKGNVVDPWYIVEKYGTDATRWYFYTINQPGDYKLFTERDISKVLNNFILTFWNCFVFFKTYQKKEYLGKNFNFSKEKLTLLDKWILSELNNLIKNVTQNLENYNITEAGRLIENFVINDLSLWYIRRSRERFQKPKDEKDLKIAIKTLHFTLLTLSKITAPFIPFLSEQIYQELNSYNFKFSQKSVHLEDWPKENKKLINLKLEKEMKKVREIVSLALAERAKNKIKVRQPLNNLQLTTYDLQGKKELLDLIKEEVNVKNISFGKNFQLDTKITPELKEKGIIREVIRHIQEMRKKMALKPKDKISVYFSGNDNINEILLKRKDEIKREGSFFDFNLKTKEKLDLEKEIDIDGEKLILGIKKI